MCLAQGDAVEGGRWCWRGEGQEMVEGLEVEVGDPEAFEGAGRVEVWLMESLEGGLDQS